MLRLGTVAMRAIKELQIPSTKEDIALHMERHMGIELADENDDLLLNDTLEGGVWFGYLQKKCDMYYVGHTKVDETGDATSVWAIDCTHRPRESRRISTSRRRSRRRCTRSRSRR